MRKLLQYILRRPLEWLMNYFAATPKQADVFRSLSNLFNSNNNILVKRTISLNFDTTKDKFIIFSDQHKGNRSWADDFAGNEKNYLAALEYYNTQNFNFINLGDSEELWKFGVNDVLQKNENSFKAESAFQPIRYYKTFGNHDVLWKDQIAVNLHLAKYFQVPLAVYEGILLNTTHTHEPLTIFLTHGHQGDRMSDSNAFSTWVIAHLWMPLQRYLRININSPSKNFTLRHKHNQMMYEWSSKQKNLVLITGHTHQPVFASGKYFKHLAGQIDTADKGKDLRPSYFNTGCCCYNDGDITGIEISDGQIRLVKWYNEEVQPTRLILEQVEIEKLIADLR